MALLFAGVTVSPGERAGECPLNGSAAGLPSSLESSMTNADSAAEWFDALDS